MIRFPDFAFVASLVVAGALLMGVSNAQPAGSAAVPVPVVVELFTSEGCSSCPSADAVLRQLEADQAVPGVEVIALGQHVDYWNRLGWRDPFSSPQLTDRQRNYAAALGTNTYTPQAVVNGQVELVGSQRAKLTQAITDAARAPRAAITLRRPDAASLAVRIGSVPTGTRGAEVILVVTESGLATPVKRGENAGRTLQHPSVVRTLQTIGTVAADGTFAATLPLHLAADWQPAHLRAVVLVQERASRRIIGGAALSLAELN
jgi:hypothetical protein